MPNERIIERLNAWAEEYLSLRETWSRVAENTPDVTAVKAEALSLIDAGDFGGARRLFGDAREKVRGARRKRAREEALLLAGEADVDRLELRYRDAVARYGEAASLVSESEFDSSARFDYVWKQAETSYLLGNELFDAANGLSVLGLWENGRACLGEAVPAYRAALDIFVEVGADHYVDIVQQLLESALKGLVDPAEVGSSIPLSGPSSARGAG